ncbi:MAG: outer membrane beta-barrel protein, partial [Prevotella sp.]|nr:outer membrane beta-barrel protein [Prevotella sp.]
TILLLAMFSFGITVDMLAQSCKTLYQEGNALVDQGKLEKAKAKFQQVVYCGDNLYVPDSKKRLEWIDRVLRKPDTVKPFSLSDNEVIIPYQGGQDVITVDGSGTWTATLSDAGSEWCKIKKEKGKIYVISEANDGSADRECEVTVRMGNKSQTVVVKNEGAPEMLIPSVENMTFPYTGETNTIEIHSNTYWEVKDVPDWVVSSKGDGVIRLTALANDNSAERTAEIKVESSTKTVIINLYQSAGLDHLAFSKNDLHFGPEGGDEYITILTAQEWGFGDFPHWCQVTKVADNLLKIHCTPNEPINLNREASVNVTTGQQTLGINVTQEAKPFVAIIPNIGIGGRKVSLSVSAGYIYPTISSSSGGNYNGSLVNYALGNEKENASYSSSGGFTVGVYADIRLYKNFYLKTGLEYLYYKYKNDFEQTYDRKVLITTLGYYTKGEVYNKYKEDYTFSNLTLPILASYRIPVTKISHLQINVGPVISYGISAKMKISGEYEGHDINEYSTSTNAFIQYYGNPHFVGKGEMNLYGTKVEYSEANVVGNDDVFTKYDKDLDCSPYKRLNFGARFGVAYEYAGVSLGVEYDLMFSNMANKKYWEGDRWMIFGSNAYTTMQGYRQHNNYLQIKIGYTFRY